MELFRETEAGHTLSSPQKRYERFRTSWSGRTLFQQRRLSAEQAGSVYPDQRIDRNIRSNIPKGFFLRELCLTQDKSCVWNTVCICLCPSYLSSSMEGGQVRTLFYLLRPWFLLWNENCREIDYRNHIFHEICFHRVQKGVVFCLGSSLVLLSFWLEWSQNDNTSLSRSRILEPGSLRDLVIETLPRKANICMRVRRGGKSTFMEGHHAAVGGERRKQGKYDLDQFCRRPALSPGYGSLGWVSWILLRNVSWGETQGEGVFLFWRDPDISSIGTFCRASAEGRRMRYLHYRVFRAHAIPVRLGRKCGDVPFPRHCFLSPPGAIW